MASIKISTVKVSSERRVFEATVSPASGNLTMGLVTAADRDAFFPLTPPTTVEFTRDTSTILGSPFEVSYYFEIDFATGEYLMRRGVETVGIATDPSLIGQELYAYSEVDGPESPNQLQVNYGLSAFVNTVTPSSIAWAAIPTNCNLDPVSASTHVIRESDEKQGSGLFDPLLATEAARVAIGRNYLDANGNNKEVYSIKAVSDVTHTLGDIVFFANYSEVEEFYGKLNAWSYSESRTNKTISLTLEKESETCNGS